MVVWSRPHGVTAALSIAAERAMFAPSMASLAPRVSEDVISPTIYVLTTIV